MARKDSLLKLHQRLQTRRHDLERAIADELGALRRERSSRAGSDDVDAASDTINSEMTSQLAQLESKELTQILRALSQLRAGTYGTCETCSKKIPVARLNALPCTTVCILCQRERESNPEMNEGLGDWQKVFDTEAASRDISVNIADLEFNLG